MKRAVQEANKLFGLQHKWIPVRVRNTFRLCEKRKVIFSCYGLCETTIIDPVKRKTINRSIITLTSDDLFLASKYLLSVQQRFINELSSEALKTGLIEIWATIANRMIQLCRQPPKHYDFHKSLYPYMRPDFHCKIEPKAEVDSRQAIYFLYFLSSAAQSNLIHDKCVMRESLALLMSSIKPSFKLSGDEISTLLSSTRIVIEELCRVDLHETHFELETSQNDDISRDNIASLLTKCHLTEDNYPKTTVSLNTIVEGVVRNAVTLAVPSLSIEQLITIGWELAMLAINVSPLFDRIRTLIMTSARCEIQTDSLLRVVEIWTTIADQDMGIFHSVASEIMNRRLDSGMTPRQICLFLQRYGCAKTLFPFVFDRCFLRLLRLTNDENSYLDWLANRMYGRMPNSDGLWHSTELPKSEFEEPLNFQIGAWDSRIFVGIHYTLQCRKEAESNEWEFYSKLLTDQLTMDPKLTLEKNPQASLDALMYPLFAMIPFESAAETQIKSDKETENLDDSVSSGKIILNGATKKQPTFAKVIIQMLEGLNCVAYYDERLLRPIGQLLAESQLRPLRSTRANKRIKQYVSQRKLPHNYQLNRGVVRQTGQKLLNEWCVSDLLTVTTSVMGGRTRMPSRAIYVLTKKLFLQLNSLNGQQLGQLMESFTQSNKGIYPGYFSEPNEMFKFTLWSISNRMMWEMSPHAISCWIVKLCESARPLIFYGFSATTISTLSSRNVEEWSISEAFQNAIEALAQKLLITYYFNFSADDIPLITHRLFQDFTWAAMTLRKSHYPQHFQTDPPKNTRSNGHLYENVFKQTGIQSFLSSVHSPNKIKAMHSFETKNNGDHSMNLFTTSETVSVASCLQNNEIKYLDPSSLDFSIQRNPGISLKDLEAIDDTHNIYYNYNTAIKSFNTVWTALLTYVVIGSVWKVRYQNCEETIGTKPLGDEIAIDVMSWEESLRIKLRQLPLKTVALFHDLVIICESANEKNESKNDYSNQMVSEALSNKVELSQRIMKHLLRHGYDGIEARHINRPDILEFIQTSIKNNKLPPLPEELQNALHLLDIRILPEKKCDILSDARIHWISQNDTATDKPVTPLSLDTEAPNSSQNDTSKTTMQNLVYRGLHLISRRLHQFLGCHSRKQMSISVDDLSPLGFNEAPSISSNSRIGPLTADLYVLKEKNSQY